MNRLLIASTLVLGFAGVAAAQEAPELTGSYSASVATAYGSADAATAPAIDFGTTASIEAPAPSQDNGFGNYSATVSDEQLRGR